MPLDDAMINEAQAVSSAVVGVLFGYEHSLRGTKPEKEALRELAVGFWDENRETLREVTDDYLAGLLAMLGNHTYDGAAFAASIGEMSMRELADLQTLDTAAAKARKDAIVGARKKLRDDIATAGSLALRGAVAAGLAVVAPHLAVPVVAGMAAEAVAEAPNPEPTPQNDAPAE